MGVNGQEKLSNITLRHNLKYRNCMHFLPYWYYLVMKCYSQIQGDKFENKIRAEQSYKYHHYCVRHHIKSYKYRQKTTTTALFFSSPGKGPCEFFRHLESVIRCNFSQIIILLRNHWNKLNLLHGNELWLFILSTSLTRVFTFSKIYRSHIWDVKAPIHQSEVRTKVVLFNEKSFFRFVVF